MNCQAFETLIADLVRNGPVDESARALALAHVKSCSRCAARLAGEQALTGILKLAAAETVEAPAHVESALISAYRARFATLPREVLARPPRLVSRAGYWRIAAALMVAMLGLAAFRLLQLHQPGRITVAGPAAQESSPRTPEFNSAEPDTLRATSQDNRITAATGVDSRGASTGLRLSTPHEGQSRTEIATEFIPLVSREELFSMESGQVVRVLLPRSAMASLGLPVNQERADRPVTAQVLIGQDGVARAIRFLNDANPGFMKTNTRSKR